VKRRTLVGTALGLVAAIALSGAALAFTGPTNGSFETGNYLDGGSGFQTLNASATDLTGWTIASGSIDWIGTHWAAADGSKSLDMNGTGPGSISQAFATTIGKAYTVTFALSGNPDGAPSVKTLSVGATGAAPATYSFDTSVALNTLVNMKWTTQTYKFTATSATTTLTFTSTTANSVYGPALDNVVVVEATTAQAKAACKKGGWKTMVDANGKAFKNQGDCVSYYATGGKNPAGHPTNGKHSK